MSKLQINPLHSVERSSVFVSRRPVDSLRFEKHVSEDGIVSYSYISDVALLLNAERLVKVLGQDNYDKLLSSSSKKMNSPYSDSSRYSDFQLFSAIKPRSVQSASEVRAWTRILLDDVMTLETEARSELQAKFEAEVQKALQQQQQQVKTE